MAANGLRVPLAAAAADSTGCWHGQLCVLKVFWVHSFSCLAAFVHTVTSLGALCALAYFIKSVLMYVLRCYCMPLPLMPAGIGPGYLTLGRIFGKGVAHLGPSSCLLLFSLVVITWPPGWLWQRIASPGELLFFQGRIKHQDLWPPDKQGWVTAVLWECPVSGVQYMQTALLATRGG